MTQFRTLVERAIVDSRYNYFGTENYDENRFGKLYASDFARRFNDLKNFVKSRIGYNRLPGGWKNFDDFEKGLANKMEEYYPALDNIYKNLNQESKDLIVKLIAYRILGYQKIRLPTNNEAYKKGLKDIKRLKYPNSKYYPHFLHIVLNKYNLRPLGYEIDIIFSDIGTVIDFIIEQYAYKINGNAIVSVEENDVVFDMGGCWGDTALYFACRAGANGKVYSFEFVPDNIKLFNINRSMNPDVEKRIELVPYPVSDISGEVIYFKDLGPGSKMESNPFEGQTGSVTTLSIDDFVERNNIKKVNFIKMDIEGAESKALAGAIKTIERFRPKLAIAIYHSMDDFIKIPKWIMDLNLGYEIYIGHYTIHAEESICFAKSAS